MWQETRGIQIYKFGKKLSWLTRKVRLTIQILRQKKWKINFETHQYSAWIERCDCDGYIALPFKLQVDIQIGSETATQHPNYY